MPAASALLVTRDDVLLEDMLRLAAAAGVELDVAHDSTAATRAWCTASVVLLGADQLAAVAAQHPARRDRVHVVAAAPVADELFRSALTVGAEHVAELPAAETWVVELLTDVADGGARRATTIGVIGGSGGIGASTFAAALAVTASSTGRPGMLIDADPLGGGIDRLVGLEDADGIRWDALLGASGRFSSRSLREALPAKDGLVVLTWSTSPGRTTDGATVREVLSAARRGNDTVVLDLPRYPDPVTTDLVSRCDHVVLVAGLTVPAVSAAGRSAAHLLGAARRVHLVTRGNEVALGPDQVATALGLPLLATMGHQRRLSESVELGLGPVHARRGPLARAARTVLSVLTNPGSGAA
ncbi:MAG TPA: septum site-determining protein Ssd [Nocardioidaceae bacterium]|nr:septum site-determining protein Ssd [Nocardioidaceae bacterium]